MADIRNTASDLKAVNPDKKPSVEQPTSKQLLDLIEAIGQEIASVLCELGAIGRSWIAENHGNATQKD